MLTLTKWDEIGAHISSCQVFLSQKFPSNLLLQKFLNLEIGIRGAGAVVLRAKLLFAIMTSHTGVPVWVLVALFLIQLPASAPGKRAEDGPST